MLLCGCAVHLTVLSCECVRACVRACVVVVVRVVLERQALGIPLKALTPAFRKQRRSRIKQKKKMAVRGPAAALRCLPDGVLLAEQLLTDSGAFSCL